ncbi:MAG: hypothetical protein ACT4OS_08910 [Acidimicrobiales bacterium]
MSKTDNPGLAEGAVPPEDRRPAEPGRGLIAETDEWVKSGSSGGGGPVFTAGGIMPGGTEFESWKRPLKGDPDAILPAGSVTRPIGAPAPPPEEHVDQGEPVPGPETPNKRRG